MSKIKFALKTNIEDRTIYTGYYNLSSTPTWYAKFGWWLARKSLREFSYPYKTYTWIASEKEHVDEAISECLNNAPDALNNPYKYIFICGYEFFDKVLASEGFGYTMSFPHGDIRYKHGSICIDVKVVPYIEGYAIINKDILNRKK